MHPSDRSIIAKGTSAPAALVEARAGYTNI
jgi:hypothetical protein